MGALPNRDRPKSDIGRGMGKAGRLNLVHG